MGDGKENVGTNFSGSAGKGGIKRIGLFLGDKKGVVVVTKRSIIRDIDFENKLSGRFGHEDKGTLEFTVVGGGKIDIGVKTDIFVAN